MTKENIDNKDNGNLLQHRDEFETVYGIISAHKKRAMNAMHNESLNMLWEVGAYVSDRLKKAAWGDGVVRMLAEYIHTRSPKAKGWSYSTIYRMVRFYDTYSSESFTQTVSRYGMQNYLAGTKQKKLPSQDGKIVSFEMTQIDSGEIVSFEMAQIPNVLFATGWTNHQIIMNRCKTDSERLFYMLYAGKEQLENKELVRVIKTNTMTSLLGSKDVQSEIMKREYPQSGVLFKDTVYLEMFGLPVKYKESKLRKEIIAHMKDFILEMGKDFLFIDDEHRIAVGGKTFKVDLLFYHRLLQCMVAIELKTDEFQPKDLGQLEFYLEALDQEERRSNENPSIGIILCKDADMEVVRYALNRSMSPTMVALYKEQLQVGSVIQRSLVEFCKFLQKGK
jgi:predicted nuclease of restriction endonuclease-like (RecB) superfamily